MLDSAARVLAVVISIRALAATVLMRAAHAQGTNQFYTLVPHNFGMSLPPMIDSLELLKVKIEMIECLGGSPLPHPPTAILCHTHITHRVLVLYAD